jgi:hypothetical protein
MAHIAGVRTLPNTANLTQLAGVRSRACRAVRSRHYSISITNWRPTPYPTACCIIDSTDATTRRGARWNSHTTAPRMRVRGTLRGTDCVASGIEGGRIWYMWMRSGEHAIFRNATPCTGFSPVHTRERATLRRAQEGTAWLTHGRIQRSAQRTSA